MCWKEGQPGYGAVFHHFENKTSTVERPLSHRQIAEVVLEYGALEKHTSMGGGGSMDNTCHPARPFLPSRKCPRRLEFLLPLSSVNRGGVWQYDASTRVSRICYSFFTMPPCLKKFKSTLKNLTKCYQKDLEKSSSLWLTFLLELIHGTLSRQQDAAGFHPSLWLPFPALMHGRQGPLRGTEPGTKHRKDDGVATWGPSKEGEHWREEGSAGGAGREVCLGHWGWDPRKDGASSDSLLFELIIVLDMVSPKSNSNLSPLTKTNKAPQ